MILQPGTETHREVVVHYRTPPDEWRGAMRDLGWSWAKALGFVEIAEEHYAKVTSGALTPPDWAPLTKALRVESQRLTDELAPLLVADPEWCESVPDPDFEGVEGGAAWWVTLHDYVCDRAYVTRFPVGGWEISNAGGPSVETTIREVVNDLEGDGETDAMHDQECWHPALRPHLREHL